MLLATFLASAASFTFGPPPAHESLAEASATQGDSDRDAARNEGWRSDLEVLVAKAQREHAGPTRPAFSDAFVDAARSLRARIPESSNDEILLAMMRLLAILDDGHSAVYRVAPGSPLAFERRVLPFKLYRFPEGLYVVDGDGEWADLAGSRIARIGGVDPIDALDRMAAYRGGDNPMTWTWMGPQFAFRQLVLLEAVGVEAREGVIEMELETLEGERIAVAVPCGEHPLVRKLRPSPATFGEPPLYLRNVETNYWMEVLPDERAVYVQFNQVRDRPGESLAAFSERLRASLWETESTSLIVDVRHNNGGNNSLVRPLVRAMIEFDMRDPEHRVFVLMGRNTFSAAQNFLNRVERWTRAVFVGEPSSSSPNFVGEENEFELPFSGVLGSISNLYWQDSDPWDRRRWIAPDLAVELTAAEYFEGVDPVLESVLAEVRGTGD